MIKKKKKYKVSLETYRGILALAMCLPEMHVTNQATGKPLVTKSTEVVLGDKIPKADRYKIKDYDPNKAYCLVSIKPVLVNHKIVLIDIYEHDGDKGIEDYLEIIQSHLEYETIFKQKIKENESLKSKFLRWLKK